MKVPESAGWMLVHAISCKWPHAFKFAVMLSSMSREHVIYDVCPRLEANVLLCTALD
jgi:hypothetical protein